MNVSSVTVAPVTMGPSHFSKPGQADPLQLIALKKSLNIQAQGISTLLQGVSGNQPLATSGHIGTKLNTIA